MVFLKELEDKGLSISGFPENSVSEQAGLDIGDLVLSVDDVEVTGIDDIRIHLLYKRKGDVVKVRILRSEEDSEQEFVFDVTL
jgi:S1-C subfamily serine protease